MRAAAAAIRHGSRLSHPVPGCGAAGLWSRLGAFRGTSAADRDRALAALEAVGLGGFARRPVGAMSAGQFQRLLFARLLVQDADLILLDEPFNAVDARTAADLLAVLRRWHGEGRTVLAGAPLPPTLVLGAARIPRLPAAGRGRRLPAAPPPPRSSSAGNRLARPG
jgi:hypothetical protein